MIADTAPIPDALLAPNYQNRLRAIGRRIDRAGLRSINVVEIAAGFLVRGSRPGTRVPDVLEFPHEDFAALLRADVETRGEGMRSSGNHPLLTTGYQDFLRALGHYLDERHVEAISITELDGLVAVTGVAPIETYQQTVMGPFQALFRADEIAALVDEAFQRRAPLAGPRGRLRLLGR